MNWFDTKLYIVTTVVPKSWPAELCTLIVVAAHQAVGVRLKEKEMCKKIYFKQDDILTERESCIVLRCVSHGFHP